jgi:hypothetical protein
MKNLRTILMEGFRMMFPISRAGGFGKCKGRDGFRRPAPRM